MSGMDDEVSTVTAETKIPTQLPVSDDAPGFHRYINSKIAATNLVHEYGAHRLDSHFSIVNIMPGWILGPEELARSKQEAFKGSNLILGTYILVLFFPFSGPDPESPNILVDLNLSFPF